MYSNETKDKFIELRAQGISYNDIIEQLGISKGTCHTWALDCEDQIKRLRAIELQAIQERVLAGYEQELTYLAEELKRVQAILRGRDYGYVDTPQLYWYQGALFSRIDKKCAPVETPKTTPKEPCDPKLNKTEQN